MGTNFSRAWKLAAAAMLPLVSFAASPDVNSVSPPGGQRGTVCEITLRGLRLEGAQQLLFYKPGINVLSLANDATQKAVKVHAKLEIPKDGELGEYPFRLLTESGITDLLVFRVGPFPNVMEVEPNNEFANPQRVDINRTVNGIVKSEDVDYYVIEAKKGQRLSAEVEAMRVGQKMFDPFIAILDTNRFELGVSDDTTLFKQDGAITAIAPYDGQYIIQIRETSYRGSEDSRYRLHIGTFARPEVVYPLGGQAGTEVEMRFIGDAGGDIVAKQKLPDTPRNSFGVFPPNDPPPSANPFRLVSFPNVMEEHSDDTNKTTRTKISPPLAFNGILSREGERDLMTFPGKKDQSYEVRVFARGMGSMLDPTISVRGPNKTNVGNNDDTRGLDSYMQFKADADGDYSITVRDHLKNGGSNYVYRVEVTGTEPELSLSVPIFKRDTQERQAVPVPQGNRNAVLLSVAKENVDGELAMLAAGLPSGVTAHFPKLHPGVAQVPVVFEAKPDAALGGSLADINIKPVVEGSKVLGRMNHAVEQIYGEPNQTVYYTVPLDRLALGVTKEAPFTIEVEQPKVPVVQGGTLRVGVVVHRKPGFEGAVKVRPLYNPPGITGPNEITIEKGSTRDTILLQAGGDAQAKTWQTAVIGSTTINEGDLWTSSPFYNLDISTPYQNGKIQMTSVEQGQVAELSVDLTNFKPFEGKAKLILSGLPVRCTTEAVEFTKDDKRVTFKVTTEEKSPAGQHKGLFCNAEIPLKDGSVNQTVAVEGVLRIDAPRKKVVEEPKKEIAKVEPPKELPAALSRLEQLRKEQGAMSGK